MVTIGIFPLILLVFSWVVSGVIGSAAFLIWSSPLDDKCGTFVRWSLAAILLFSGPINLLLALSNHAIRFKQFGDR